MGYIQINGHLTGLSVLKQDPFPSIYVSLILLMKLHNAIRIKLHNQKKEKKKTPQKNNKPVNMTKKWSR